MLREAEFIAELDKPGTWVEIECLTAPDPKRHPLLVPFRPERLRATWLAVIVSLWAWLAASIVALVAAVVLLGRAL